MSQTYLEVRFGQPENPPPAGTALQNRALSTIKDAAMRDLLSRPVDSRSDAGPHIGAAVEPPFVLRTATNAEVICLDFACSTTQKAADRYHSWLSRDLRDTTARPTSPRTAQPGPGFIRSKKFYVGVPPPQRCLTPPPPKGRKLPQNTKHVKVVITVDLVRAPGALVRFQRAPGGSSWGRGSCEAISFMSEYPELKGA